MVEKSAFCGKVESLKYFVRMFWDSILIFNLLSLSFFVRGVLISIRTLIPWLTFVKVRQ